MRFVDRLKTSYDLWKLNKYTKRRTAPPIDWDDQIVQGVDNAVIDPMNFSNRSPEFYEYYYEDGVYYNLPGTQGHDMAGQRMSYVSPRSNTGHLVVETEQTRRRSHADLSTLYESEELKKSRSSNVPLQQSPSSPAFSNRSSPSPSSPQFTQYEEPQRRSNRRNPQARNSEAYNFNY